MLLCAGDTIVSMLTRSPIRTHNPVQSPYGFHLMSMDRNYRRKRLPRFIQLSEQSETTRAIDEDRNEIDGCQRSQTTVIWCQMRSGESMPNAKGMQL